MTYESKNSKEKLESTLNWKKENILKFVECSKKIIWEKNYHIKFHILEKKGLKPLASAFTLRI